MSSPNKIFKRFITNFLVLFATLIFVTNYFPITSVLSGLEPLIHLYKYQTSDCKMEMIECPEKGTKFDEMFKQFENKKRNGEIPPDIVLNRQFSKNYMKFWKWRDYFTNNRWKLDYKGKCK